MACKQIPEHINQSTENNTNDDSLSNSINRMLHTFPSLPSSTKTSSLFTTSPIPSEVLHEVVQLLPMLSENRCKEKESWLTIGSILYNISIGSRNGIEAWITFSTRTNTFTVEDCMTAWIDMKPSYHTIRILYYYVKIDNIEAYTMYKTMSGKNKFSRILKTNNLDLTEYDWAEIMHLLYKDEFFYYDHWYSGELFEWKIMKNCIDLLRFIPNLRLFINEEITEKNNTISKIRNERQNIEERPKTDENDRLIEELNGTMKTLEEKVNKLKESKKQLNTTGFKNNIIKECKVLFYDKTILQSIKNMNNEINMSNSQSIDNTTVEHNLNKDTTHYPTTSTYSPLELFIQYLVIEDTEYKEDIILLSSSELLKKSTEFCCKYNINHVFTINSIIKNADLKKINGITIGIRQTKKDPFTNKIIDSNKTKFNKSEIKKYFSM